MHLLQASTSRCRVAEGALPAAASGLPASSTGRRPRTSHMDCVYFDTLCDPQKQVSSSQIITVMCSGRSFHVLSQWLYKKQGLNFYVIGFQRNIVRQFLHLFDKYQVEVNERLTPLWPWCTPKCLGALLSLPTQRIALAVTGFPLLLYILLSLIATSRLSITHWNLDLFKLLKSITL